MKSSFVVVDGNVKLFRWYSVCIIDSERRGQIMWVYFGLGVGGIFFLVGIIKMIVWIKGYGSTFGERYEELNPHLWIFYGSVLLLLTHIAFPESL